MTAKHIRKFARSLWQYLREVSGENDYARYCARVKLNGGKPPSPQAFYIEQLERKNSRPARCC